MNIKCPQKSIKLYSFTLPVFIFAGLFLFGLFLTSQGQFPGQNQGQVLSKKASSQEAVKESKAKKVSTNAQGGGGDQVKNPGTGKAFDGDSNQGVNNTNAPKNKANDSVVTQTLTAEEVVEEIADTQDDTDEIIEDVVAAPKWQTILLGTSYKNLGALRSQLARNENTIRKLNKEMVKNDGSDDQLRYQEQIGLMKIEQERIRNVLQVSENQFSLLGWVYKFLNGSNYTGGDDVDTDGTDSVIDTDGTEDTTSPSDTSDTLEVAE